MTETAPSLPPKANGSKLGLWLALGALALVLSLFLFGKYTDFVNLDALQEAIRQFADGPWGIPALILAFCACAFIGVPQFVLIGIAVYAFGPVEGAIWSWIATMISGAITFWLGRFFGAATLARLGEGRVKRFTNFIARNVFAASAIVRNAPAGPFLMVNMVFGAVHAKFLHYWAGMGLGIVPKIAMVAFGLQAIQAALGGNIWVAVGAGISAIAVFLGGYLYVSHRRHKGENIALGAE